MITALLVVWVLGPLLLYGPRVLDDSRLDGGALGLLAMLGALVLLRRREPLHPPPGVALILGAGAVGAVVLLFQDRAWTELVGGLADRAPWCAAPVFLVLASQRRAALAAAWPALWLGLALSVWIALLQLVGLDLFRLRPMPEAPPTGWLSNRPQAVELWSVGLCAGLGWWSAGQRRLHAGSAAWWALLPAAFLCGYLDSLAGRLALLAGLGLLVFRERGRLPLAAALLVALLVGEGWRLASPPPWAHRDPGEAGAPAWSSTEGRAHMYGAALGHAARHPLGLGWGRFETDYPEWRPVAEQRISAANYQNVANRRPKTPHSEPLLVLLEAGWLGALLLGLGLVRLLRDPERARWTDPALVALGVHALVRSPLSDHGSLLALSVLLLAARRLEAATVPAQQRAPTPLSQHAWRGGLLALGLLAVLPAPAQIAGEFLVAARIPLDQAKDPALLERATRWRPWDARALGLLSRDRAAQEGVSFDEVYEPLLQAVQHDPTDLFALNELFILDTKRGQGDLGLVWLMRAEQFAADHPAVRTNRTLLQREVARFHRENGQRMLQAGAPNAHQELFLGLVWTAMAEARDGYPLKAASALRGASLYAQGNRGLLERVARDPELSESHVRSLVERVVPPEELRYLSLAPPSV